MLDAVLQKSWFRMAAMWNSLEPSNATIIGLILPKFAPLFGARWWGRKSAVELQKNYQLSTCLKDDLERHRRPFNVLSKCATAHEYIISGLSSLICIQPSRSCLRSLSLAFTSSLRLQSQTKCNNKIPRIINRQHMTTEVCTACRPFSTYH